MADKQASSDEYSLGGTQAQKVVAAPELPYKPRDPYAYNPQIGLIGCGGISESHLKAYSKAGYRVTALCDLIPERASKRQEQFYPGATTGTNYHELLERPEIEVVDIATHPADRLPIIEDAIKAGKHVLSQKPFVLDLKEGERLVRLADEHGVKLAVNQNGRWAPHFSYIRQAVHAGLIGDLISVHQAVHWDHTWTIGTKFEEIRDLVLYDFAIHWFDFVSHLLGNRPWQKVLAVRTRSLGQTAKPAMLAQAIIQFEGGQASLVFDASLKFDSRDTTYVGGSTGSIRSEGANLGEQVVTITTEAGASSPVLEGSWFPDGFHGTMGELLCAIEENREPVNSARENLRGLGLCFAAIASADSGEAVVPGQVLHLQDGKAR
jgi:predicted dehydrogenase